MFTEEEVGEFNFEQHKKNPDQTTVADLHKTCEEMFSIRKVIEDKEKEISELNSKLDVMKQKVLGVIEEFDIPNVPTKYGTISPKTINTFKVPKDIDKKKEFMMFLESKGMLDALVTFNHQTFNAQCRTWMEENGGDLNFSIPGVDEPSAYRTIAMIKPKNRNG